MRELQSKTRENGPILRVHLESLVSQIHIFSANKFYKSEIVCQILGQQVNIDILQAFWGENTSAIS